MEKCVTICVSEVTKVTETLCEAFARWMPQLSPRLGPPSGERLRALAASPTTALFTACEAGVPLGTLTLVWYDAPSGRKAWIEDVVVDGAARGRGVGEALVRAALERAAAVGAEKVSLTSNPARRAAHGLYRKMGFTPAATALFVRPTGATPPASEERELPPRPEAGGEDKEEMK